jgi:hypothetical protein
MLAPQREQRTGNPGSAEPAQRLSAREMTLGETLAQ